MQDEDRDAGASSSNRRRRESDVQRERRQMSLEDIPRYNRSYSQSVYQYYPAAYFERDNYNHRLAHDPYWSHVPHERQRAYVPASSWRVTNSPPGGYDVIRHPPGRERSNARWNRFYSSEHHDWVISNRAQNRHFNNELFGHYTRHFNARQSDVQRRRRRNYSTLSRGTKRRRDQL